MRVGVVPAPRARRFLATGAIELPYINPRAEVQRVKWGGLPLYAPDSRFSNPEISVFRE